MFLLQMFRSVSYDVNVVTDREKVVMLKYR